MPNLAQELAQRVVKKWRTRQGITDSGPLPLGADQTRGPQDGELMGNERLRKTQHFLQIADAKALSGQNVDQAQTGGI